MSEAQDNRVVLAVSEFGPIRKLQLQNKLGYDYRFLDRCLQRLRKKGTLIFNPSNGWSIATQENVHTKVTETALEPVRLPEEEDTKIVPNPLWAEDESWNNPEELDYD